MILKDEDLVEQLKLGSDEAFEELYRRYSQSLLRHLFCLMGNKEEAEEMLHECMMLMIQKINFYSHRPDLNNSFKSWLYRLSTNRAIDEIRKRKEKVTEEQEILDSAQLDEIYENKEKEELIGSYLMKLPLVQRTLLSLRVQDDLSYMEISVICGKDVNAVKQGLFQARRTMKDYLLSHGELV